MSNTGGDRLEVIVSAELKPLSDAMSKLQANADKLGTMIAANMTQAEKATVGLDTATKGASAAQDQLAASTSRVSEGLRKQVSMTGVNISETRKMEKETRLAAMQMQQMSYQLNDIATMVAYGASPFNIIASQAGQVYQALSMGEGGLVGGLKAVGASVSAMISAVNPLGLAFGAVTVAAGAFYLASRKNVPDLNETMKAHEDILDQMAEKYGKLSDRVKSFGQETRNTLDLGIATTQSDLEKNLKSATKDLYNELSKFNPSSLMYEAKDQFAFFPELKKAVEDYLRSYEQGTPKINEFREAIAAIASESNNMLPKDLIPTIDKLTKDSKTAADAIDQLKLAVKETTPEFLEMVQKSKLAADAFAELYGAAPALRNAFEEINFQYDKYIKNSTDSLAQAGAEKTRMRALAELARDAKEQLAEAQDAYLNVGKEGAQRDLDEVRQAANREIEEFKRTNGSPEGLAALEKKREIDLLTVRREAIVEYAEGARDRLRSIADEAIALNAQQNALGKSAGAVKALQVETEALTEARREAAMQGMMVSDTEIENIKAMAQYIGEATDRLSAMRLEQQLLFDRSQMFRSDADAAAQAAVRGAGLDPKSADALKLMGDVKLNENLKELKGTFREAFSGIGEEILNATSAMDLFEASIDRVKNIALKQFDKIIEKGADALFAAFTGGMQGDPTLSPLATPNTVTAISTMTVTAATVMVNGAPLGGLPGSGSDVVGTVAGIGKDALIERSKLPPLGSGGVLPANAELSRTSSDVNPAGSVSATMGKNGLVPVNQVAAYIEKAAAARGIDPGTALKVARSEGLGEGIWQSSFKKGSFREPSYGPFQLLKGGKGTGFPEGMGNAFQRQTGLDPANPKNTFAGIDFALDGAAKNGWGAWYGAAKVGVGKRTGLGSARPIGVNTNNEAPLAAVEKSGTQLAEASNKLATSVANDVGPKITGTLTAFGSSFDASTKTMVDGMEGSIADFLPKFGGSLDKLLSSIAQGVAGGGAVMSNNAVAASLANVGGKGGFFAEGGVSHQAAIFGEAGPEAAVPLPDGRSIPVTMRVQGGTVASSGGGSGVKIYDQRGSGAAAIETKNGKDENGNDQIEVFVRDTARKEMTQPGSKGRQQMKSDFGLKDRVMVR